MKNLLPGLGGRKEKVNKKVPNITQSQIQEGKLMIQIGNSLSEKLNDTLN